MKKLLILTQTMDERDQVLGFFIEWVRRFSNQFSQVIVLCLNKGHYSLPENVKVISLGKGEGVSRIGILFNFYKNTISLRSDYDSVLVHMNPIYVVLGGIIWKTFKKKVALWYTHKSVTWKLKLAEHGSDIIFTASKESFRLPSDKLVITGHGIDTDVFKPNLNPESAILSVGRIAPVKNYGALIDALKILKDSGIILPATIVGAPLLDRDQVYLKKIKDRISQLALTDQIRFTGAISYKDLPEIYQSHKLFVHMSHTGSLDKTILEAMASGCQVVSSNDASKGFLDPIYIFNDRDPGDLPSKIKNLLNRLVDQKLRDYVVENHDLGKLIVKISGYLS